MQIVQISDFHIVEEGLLLEGQVDTSAFLGAAVSAINQLEPRPGLVVASGDLTENGGAGQYARLARLLSPLAMPFYLMPGNHDDRHALRAAFPAHPYLGQGFMQYEVDAGPLRLLCLDSLDSGHGGGRLCQQRLDWLASRLELDAHRPVAIFMHHPPIQVGIPFMDRIALSRADADALGHLIRRHGRVVGLYCGHLHRSVAASWHGVQVVVAPGVAHQIYPDARPDGHAAFVMEPPGMLLHRWVEGAGLVTQVQAIGDYGPVYPYLD